MHTTASQHVTRIEAAIRSGQAARSSVAASWARSATLYHLDPAAARLENRLTASELAVACERSGTLLPTAAPHLDRLFHSVGGLGACIVLADVEGVALDRRGNVGDDRDFASAGLWTGTAWSEARAGTNGIGTCLAEGRAVTIHRDQHFLARNIGLSCSSAPVFGPEGELMAVIDVSTARSDLPEAVSGLIGATVTEAARRVEADLFSQRFPRARLVLVPGTERGIGATLAVDANDLVIGATRAARLHLNLSGNLAASPRPLADLLGQDAGDGFEDAERAVIARALARSGGNISAAARALGLSRATLHRKLDRR
ncbi:helix-turn-helix domain-containing protein [Tabrizicola sp.]|jgi:transcriptional regulator of acetoin/glycerol metabolism|uniref:helix-turn-helix domain-containing protein n=1 Tax=Tabrizicola sp. TaxID=2005166 RepID=UPI001A4995E6|nr:helix-turn-helix domain-containing protein [Tabrizicola sp.]MBL9063049.1 sigma-54-dependent Fis family transcriptional regulator [Tabrizicola sp.]